MNFNLAPAILAGLLLCSCASARVAPRFDRPSTQPIAKAHQDIKKQLASAQTKLTKLEQENPTLKLQVASINVDLSNALSALDVSEGARKQLDAQLKQQTDKANGLADSFDKSQLKIKSLQTSRHRWVKYLMYSLGLNLAATAWIFRKPIMLLLTGL